MKYIYCEKCKKPIRATTSFYQVMVKGAVNRKPLKDGCGESFPYCMECYLSLKQDDVCINSHCRKMIDGKCGYKVKQKGE